MDCPVKLLSLYFFRQTDKNEGEGETGPADSQSHTGDQSPQTQEEPPHQLDPSPPAIPESNKEENETERDQDKSLLSSSLIIEVPNVQSSMELSTIAGTTVGLWFSEADLLLVYFSLDL